MAVDVSGSTAGSSVVSTPAPVVVRWLFGSSSAGTGASAGDTVYHYIFSGHALGQGSLSDPFDKTLSGNASGAANVGAATPFGHVQLGGYAVGTGFLGIAGAPVALLGMGTLAGHIDVRSAAPLCSCQACDGATFRWGQVLTEGDLWIRFKEAMNPISPYCVKYSLYQRLPGGSSERLIGAPNRCALSSKVGEFYAVWDAGEGGQPGDWVVVWKWQRTAGGAVGTQRSCFRVLDAATAKDPYDCTPRVKKYGWF